MDVVEPNSTVSVTSELAPVSLVVRDVEVVYRVHEEGQNPTLKRLVSRRLHRRAVREIPAVRGVSFVLHEGEALGLIGRNGSGKTSLLRAIAGLIPKTNGSVRARSMPVLLGVGAALKQDLTGRRNVLLGGTALGIARRKVLERFDDIVEFAGVRDFIDVPIRAYSSGMDARLRFALATSVVPDILLIDELLAVGDEEFRRRSERRMKELLEHAGTVVLVSHSLSSISDVCSRVIWLDEGRIVMDGPTEEVLPAYEEDAKARMGTSP